jgi:RNA polymerase sigma-70 factor (ECF subfamily)
MLGIASFLPNRAVVETSRTTLETLFFGHFDFIWRSARRLGLEPCEADDAAQEVFAVAARRLDAIEHGSERPFLFQTLVNVVRNARRTVRRRREEIQAEVELDGVAESPHEAMERKELRETAHRILAAMDLDQSTVFVLVELEGLTMHEVAELHGVPKGTVASRLRRARAFFSRQAVREEEGP